MLFNIFLKPGLIDYNFVCFRQAIQEVFEVRMQVQQANNSGNVTASELIQPLSSVALKE